MQKKYNKIMYAITTLALGLLIILASSARAENMQKPELQIEPGIYVFVSFSINDHSLDLFLKVLSLHIITGSIELEIYHLKYTKYPSLIYEPITFLMDTLDYVMFFK